MADQPSTHFAPNAMTVYNQKGSDFAQAEPLLLNFSIVIARRKGILCERPRENRPYFV